ncbi:hypothetical protein FRB90_011990 [Tulasnella sp. 427]|nr:hypothetical protein FRB90_011990 [Tulasnella sp. 427]
MDSLPSELLADILLLSTDDDIPRCRQTLALVCHQWHTVVYDTQRFWAQAALHRTASELQETLHRNPFGPLDVVWLVDLWQFGLAPNTMKNMNTISAESTRWRSLTLTGDISPYVKSKLLDMPIPKLNELCIWDTLFLQTFSLQPGRSFDELGLHTSAIDWTRPRLKDLKILQLYRLTTSSVSPSLNRLLDILSVSPQMQILELVNVALNIDERSNNCVQTGNDFTFPSLNTLVVSGIQTLIAKSLVEKIKALKCRQM